MRIRAAGQRGIQRRSAAVTTPQACALDFLPGRYIILPGVAQVVSWQKTAPTSSKSQQALQTDAGSGFSPAPAIRTFPRSLPGID